jgi:hypothetical protein
MGGQVGAGSETGENGSGKPGNPPLVGSFSPGRISNSSLVLLAAAVQQAGDPRGPGEGAYSGRVLAGVCLMMKGGGDKGREGRRERRVEGRGVSG